jgi:hypothetical protein
MSRSILGRGGRTGRAPLGKNSGPRVTNLW